MTIPIFIVHLLLTGLMMICINLLGSVKKGYVTLDQLLSTTNFGYNLIYRILSPVIYISFATLILFNFKLSFFVSNIWLLSVYYYGLNLITLVLLSRFELVNKFLYFFMVISSIGLSYWVYMVALRYGPQSIIPDSANFRTEWWFLVFGYFYSLLNDFSPNYAMESNRKRKFICRKYNQLKRKYQVYLSKGFQENNDLQKILYSIMITESTNRPPFIRFIEKLMFFTGKVKTTGIMQVTSSKKLSDKESIGLAEKIIQESYNKHFSENINGYDLVGKIATDYNPGSYGYEILENYRYINEL